MSTENKNTRWERWRNKFRFVILNDDTFEEYFTVRLSPLNIFVSVILFVAFTVSLTALIIAYTPLRELVPGQTSSSMRREALSLSAKADSLEAVLKHNEQYLFAVQQILQGKPVEEAVEGVEERADSASSVAFTEPSTTDSALRQWVEQEELFSVGEGQNNLDIPLLFAPLNGVLSGNYDGATAHYGVDITASKNTPIKACLEGTVIFADWSSETGHVIIIQHDNNILSAYKHNSALLKSIGDPVKTGEAIAIIGNSGENTTGPHLHFELWYGGAPVNPENYINF